jgi:hypothetical protein
MSDKKITPISPETSAAPPESDTRRAPRSASNGKATKSVWATGLTAVQGCGFDSSGNFYATEFQVNGLNPSPTGNPLGAVVKIAPNGTRITLGMGSLFFPSGFAAWNGTLYLSNCSIAPATGLAPTLCASGGQMVAIH